MSIERSAVWPASRDVVRRSEIEWREGDPSEPGGSARVGLYLSHRNGASHLMVALVELEPGGIVTGHLHSFEESFYVLEGEALLQRGGQSHRLAADDCVLSLPEARIGMIPAGGASQTLSRVVGTGAALATVLLSDRIAATDAFDRGFVDEVVPRADLAARSGELARAIASRPPAAMRAAKAAVWASLDLSLEEGLRRERELAALA